MRYAFFALFMLAVASLRPGLQAQGPQTIDRIIAIVGEDVILQSDVENDYAYLIANGQNDDGTLKCQILERHILEKLMLNKARQDSIEVTDNEVENELERKLNYFIQGYGGVEPLEEVYGKSLVEIKAFLRPDIKNSMLVDRMRQKIVSNVQITPKEVKKFYQQIPRDSLPYLPAEVELYHIVKKPEASEEADAAALEMIQGIRQEILNGTIRFPDAAKKYSQDYGSAQVGGDLGTFGRGRMVPEFEGVAFKTKEGEISQPFRTDYGWHIMLVYKRLGEQVGARHILITPRVSIDDDSTAVRELRTIRKNITETDTLDFHTAAKKYSTDQTTNTCGGCIKNPQTGDLRIPLDLLDADFYLKVDEMEVGEITQPLEWYTPDNKKAFHLLYLKRRIPPHVANLGDDYQKIQDAALQAKQANALEEWFESAKKNIFIELKEGECKEIITDIIER